MGIKGLVSVPATCFWSLVGSTTAHPDNHYLTSRALVGLAELAALYRRFDPTAPLLHLNDASLERGGLFDIRGNWQFPHETHGRGTAIDVRANAATGAIPPANYSEFIQLAQDVGGRAAIHNPGTTNQHFHVTF